VGNPPDLAATDGDFGQILQGLAGIIERSGPGCLPGDFTQDRRGEAVRVQSQTGA
jgi:hypothetical protein